MTTSSDAERIARFGKSIFERGLPPEHPAISA
jgi:hypothetical protein